MEDFEPFRTLIYALIKDVSWLQVVGEAPDGLVALEKARELRPDLLLMDIGLPGLNGIETARRVRELLPNSKIVFITQETDPEVVREALSLGACGYLLKSRAGHELLAAIEGAFQGKSYVSDELAGHNSQSGDSSDPVR